MAHRYGQPFAVIRATDGTPVSFRWRDCEWAVSEVINTWHLQDRWWEQPASPATATYSLRNGAPDRTYYLVCCRDPGGIQIFDLYHDAVSLTWMLDVAQD